MTSRRVSQLDRERGAKLGAYLKGTRVRASMSAQELAESTDLSIDTVRSIETGRTLAPSFQTVLRIAEALGVTLEDVKKAVL